MRRAAIIVTLVGVLWLVFGLVRSSGSAPSPSTVAASAADEVSPVGAAAAVTAEGDAPAVASLATRAPAADTGVTSLQDMARTLNEYSQTGHSLRDLVEYLGRTNQQPSLTRDANPYTGEMVIVRTQSPLPGTRYFHAQYFSDESNQLGLQHMSFEFRPGESAMADAQAAVAANFPMLTTPKYVNADFIKWELGNGYNVWIKRMDMDDLADDPFNAYTAADIGTVRVAVEAEIHGDHDDDGH